MRSAIAAVVWLLLASPAQAVVTAAWLPPTTGDAPTGYRVLYGLSSGAETWSVDAGLVLYVAVPNLLPNTRYFFVVRAYNADGTGPPSNEVAFDVPPDPCAYPLGAKSISIFPTKLTTTGSGQGGSKFRVDFQVASPNSPVNFVGIKLNGVEVKRQGGANADVTDLAGLWAYVPQPPGVYNIGLFALNVAGCMREQTTTYSITVR